MNDEMVWNRKLGFGKYALSKWKDMEDEYLEFLVSNECRTSEENKRLARIEIERRWNKGGQK